MGWHPGPPSFLGVTSPAARGTSRGHRSRDRTAGHWADRSREDVDLAGAQFVGGPDHLQFARLDELRHDRVEALQALDALLDVGPGDVLELVAGAPLGRDDGGPDRVDHVADG